MRHATRLTSMIMFLIHALCFPTYADEAADSALLSAISEGDLTSLNQALKAGANVNVKNSEGAPALSAAILARKPEIAHRLIAAGADLAAPYEGYIGANALMLAIEVKDLDLARSLLNAGANVDQPDTIGDPAINWAAYYGYTDFVKLFLEYGSRTDQRGHGNAREIVMRRGHQDLVHILSHHDKVPAPSPAVAKLVEAIEQNAIANIKAILATGVSPDALDSTGRPLLALAARQGLTDVVTTLLNAGASVDAADEIGFTPLMEAAREGQVGTASLLLDASADVNHVSLPTGMALGTIHMAALSGSIDMIDLVAHAGANIDLQGRDGGTALSWSLSNKSIDAPRHMLKIGANPYIKSKYGSNVADYILNADNHRLAELKPLVKAEDSYQP